jgi:hypothetical protein
MKTESQTPLPPYFNIDPDSALSHLGAPTDTDDFDRIAKACAAGRHDLRSRGLGENGSRKLRPFSTWEITRYLIPVATGHFRRVLKQNPDLPQGHSDTAGGAKWFSFEEVLRLRAHFAAEGSKTKNYLPYRPPGLPAKIVAARRHAERGTGRQGRRPRAKDPLAQYRSDRRAAESLLGRIPDPGLAHGQPRLEIVGCAERQPGAGRAAGRL